MQRAEDREADDKDDRGGGRTGLLTLAPAITTTTTATRRPLSKRKREVHDDYDDNDDIEREQDDEEEKKADKIMPPYKSKVRVLDEYHIIGFISSGTYGRVYKAKSKIPGNNKEFAIKK
jgi:cyclin-dependent kinase 8/11